MSQKIENPALGQSAGPGDNAFPGGNYTSELTQKAHISQEESRPSRAVAATIQRAKQRSLSIKRGSLWNLCSEASARLDGGVEALEDEDDDAFFNHVRRFIETARAIGKLAKDLRDSRNGGAT
jgi:hypothetical protein